MIIRSKTFWRSSASLSILMAGSESKILSRVTACVCVCVESVILSSVEDAPARFVECGVEL